jgi:alpha-glucosidase
MLSLYKEALTLRRILPALGEGHMRWIASAPDVLAFERDPGFICIVNLSTEAISLPPHSGVAIASGPLEQDALPPDTSAWLTR